MAKLQITSPDELNQQVLAFLLQDELDYPGGAIKFGEAALPFLSELITSNDEMLATKATYLAGYIGGDSGAAAIEKAADAGFSTVRLAAAFGAKSLPDSLAKTVLSKSLDDHDPGVQKLALRSITDRKMHAAFKTKLQKLAKGGMNDDLKAQAATLVKKLK